MSAIVAKVIGIRPQTNSKNDQLFWNVGFRLEQPIQVATGLDDSGKPILETADTFSMASDTEFPEEALEVVLNRRLALRGHRRERIGVRHFVASRASADRVAW